MTRQQPLIALLIAAFLIGSCASTRHIAATSTTLDPNCDNQCQSANRRQAYISQNPHLSDKFKAAVLEGRVLLGMTMEDVIASIGKPDQKQETTTWAAREQWIYHSGTELARLYVFQFGKVNSWRQL